MADEFIRITTDDEGVVHIIGQLDVRSRALLRDAVFDIADELEREAKELAPTDKDPDAYTWRDRPGLGRKLKEHPVDVFKSRGGGSVTNIPSFGGGFSVRGAGGRFVSGGASIMDVGDTQGDDVFATVRVTEDPDYAIFVHEGTAAHVPVNAEFMRYKSFGKWRRMKFVAGQEPQPYLTEAYEIVENGYANIRMQILRAELEL